MTQTDETKEADRDEVPETQQIYSLRSLENPKQCGKRNTKVISDSEKIMNAKKAKQTNASNSQLLAAPNKKIINDFICSKCDKIFSRKDSLQRHVRNFCKK